jgi:hypothetical protein
MTGQILSPGKKLVNVNNEIHAIYERSYESVAFEKWQKKEFAVVERDYAQKWRSMLKHTNAKENIKKIQEVGINYNTCKTLLDAKKQAEEIISSTHKSPYENMRLALLLLNLPENLKSQIHTQWSSTNYKPIIEYAPYTSYIAMVELFFHIAMSSNLISTERPSHYVDIAYLFYLPFCMQFTSSDKLHCVLLPNVNGDSYRK